MPHSAAKGKKKRKEKEKNNNWSEGQGRVGSVTESDLRLEMTTLAAVLSTDWRGMSPCRGNFEAAEWSRPVMLVAWTWPVTSGHAEKMQEMFRR